MPTQMNCQRCGKPFLTRPVNAASGRAKYCSRSCSGSATSKGNHRNPHLADAWKKARAVIEERQPWKTLYPPRIAKTCESCGSTFHVIASRNDTARFCSRACSSAWKRTITGTNHPLFTRIERVCEVCGKTVWVKYVHQERFRFCSRRCTGVFVSKMLADSNGPTSIERLLADELTARHIAFVPQKVIACWLVDFAIPEHRIAIECDGTYWHNSDIQKVKDANKDHWLAAHNWTMVRLTEPELKADIAACVDRIVKLLPRPRAG